MKTKTIKISDGVPAEQAVQEAAQALAQGGLVAFPTETVYGLAARGDMPAALGRLAAVKERAAEKPFTLHLGSKSELGGYVGRLKPLDRALVRKAWPGPLTIVFVLSESEQAAVRERFSAPVAGALYHEGTIGVRTPAHEVAQALLCRAGGPVVAPSANAAGKRPPTCADDVLAQLDGQVDLVLDAGSTRYAQSSTVVRLDGEDMEVLRQGVLDAAAVRRMRTVTILFVCTGNTCRSPMAEGLCRRRLAQKLGCPVDQLEKKGYKVMSAGVAACKGARASAEAVGVCRDLKVDIGGHRSRPLTAALINSADYVFVMTEAHREAVLGQVPRAGERTVLLGGTAEVPDPIGQSLEVYRQCARQINEALAQRLIELFGE